MAKKSTGGVAKNRKSGGITTRATAKSILGTGLGALAKKAADGARRLAADTINAQATGSKAGPTVSATEQRRMVIRDQRDQKKKEAATAKKKKQDERNLKELELKEKHESQRKQAVGATGSTVKIKQEMMDESDYVQVAEEKNEEQDVGDENMDNCSKESDNEYEEESEKMEDDQSEKEEEEALEGEVGSDDGTWAGIEAKREEKEKKKAFEEREKAIKDRIQGKPIEKGAESESQSGGQGSAEDNQTDLQSTESNQGTKDNEDNEVEIVEKEKIKEVIILDEEVTETEATKPNAPKMASFKDVTMGKMKQQVMGARLKYQHTSRFEISVYVSDLPEQPTDDQQATAVKEVLNSLLKRFKHLTKRVAIVPWSDNTLLPSLEKTEQISYDLNVLRNYIKNEGTRERSFRKGRNSRLLVRVTYDKITGGHDEVQHLWQLHKNDASLKKYWDIVLKPACMQKETYYPLGWFINSSEKQITRALEEGLGKELEVPIEVNYRDVPAEYRNIDEFWKHAKNRAKGNIRESYNYAPQGLVVYTNVKTGRDRMRLIATLNRKYGRMTTEGKYPMLPDGSRMRFMPTENMIPVGDRAKIKQAIQRQITLRERTATIDMEFNVNINQKILEGPHKGKLLGQLILALTSADEKYGGVPFFKHFVHKWAHSFAFTGLSVAVFEHMAPNASEIMGSLYGIMERTYGPEVARFVQVNLRGGASLTNEGDLDAAAFNITLDDDDWFEGGSANFVMTGVFGQPSKRAKDTEQREREEERKLIIASDKTEQLIETLSVVTTFTSETDATAKLNGKFGGGDHGYSEGKQGKDTERKGDTTEESTQQPASDEKNSDEGNSNDNSDGKESEGECNKAGEDSNEDEERNQGRNSPERATNSTSQQEQTRHSNRDNAHNETGRGRSGGRGRGQGGRGRGRGQEDINSKGRPAMVSPMNPKSQTHNKGILKNGSSGGSGPKASTGEQDNPEKDWIPVGSDADRANLLKQFEENKDSNGTASGEQNP